MRLRKCQILSIDNLKQLRYRACQERVKHRVTICEPGYLRVTLLVQYNNI